MPVVLSGSKAVVVAGATVQAVSGVCKGRRAAVVRSPTVATSLLFSLVLAAGHMVRRDCSGGRSGRRSQRQVV